MFVRAHKPVNDFTPEILPHVINDIAYAKPVCDSASVFDAAQTAACFAADADSFIVKKPHSCAGGFVAGFAYQIRSHTRIDTAAHSDKRLLHGNTLLRKKFPVHYIILSVKYV